MTAPRVTDHALLRYIERVHGVDVEALRAELAASLARAATAAAPIGGEYRILTGGRRFICQDDRVVTVTVKGKR